MAKEFEGEIKLDIRDSTPDWSPYLAGKAPDGAPNVLIILYDDTGLAGWSPFGGRIEMPTMDRLAKDGLTYSQWHTTALCGPTRSCFLTGRNHHQNSFATIAETATGFPGNNTHIPMENAFQAEVLRENGWSTRSASETTPTSTWSDNFWRPWRETERQSPKTVVQSSLMETTVNPAPSASSAPAS